MNKTIERSERRSGDGEAVRAPWYLPLLLGGGAMVLLSFGLSGLGDAPSPQGSATDIATHFGERRNAVLWAAPFGYAGAAALLLFAAHVAGRLHAVGELGAAIAVAVGAGVVATYFAGIQLVFTTLAYEVADESPHTAKGLFVVTILAVPVLGAGVATLLAGFAYGARTARLVPRSLVVASAVGAVLSSLALVSFARSEFFSPDVQQQVAGTLGMLWPGVVGGALSWRARRATSGRLAA